MEGGITGYRGWIWGRLNVGLWFCAGEIWNLCAKMENDRR